MKKLLMAFIASSLLIVPSSGHAENSIGFAAGSTRGFGATYRHLPDAGAESSLGWQVAGLPFITKEEGPPPLSL